MKHIGKMVNTYTARIGDDMNPVIAFQKACMEDYDAEPWDVYSFLFGTEEQWQESLINDSFGC